MAEAGWRAALDYDQTSKSEGALEGDHSKVFEQRTSLLMAWGLSDRFSLIARLPVSRRELTESESGETERSVGGGRGDPELQAQVRLWGSAFAGSVGVRTSVYGLAGIKSPWGENDLTRRGERLDEHAQPGTGSTDGIVGVSLVHQFTPRAALIASVQQRMTGSNDTGYRYGSTTLINVAVEHKLGARFDAVLEANWRDAASDAIHGMEQENTGGRLWYLTPHLLWTATRQWVVRAAVQLPAGQSGLNGVQHESAVWNMGVTWVAAGR